MPRPLNTLWYWPAKRSLTRWLVRIWIFRTVRSCSRESTADYGTGTPSKMRFTTSSASTSSASASYVTINR